MSRYSYIARTKQGTKDTGVLEAASEDDAVSVLQKRELVVTSIIHIDKRSILTERIPGESKVRKFKRNSVRFGDLTILSRQLSLLLGAGVSLIKSISVTQKQIESKRLNDALSDITKEMEAGRTFKDALVKHKNIFSELWIYLVETGEASGNLPKVLDHLANYLEEQQAFRTKIISALMYPAILFLISICAVIFFVTKIVPTFSKILTEMNVPLPMPTRILIGISNLLIHRFVLFIIIGVAAVFVYKKLIKNDAVASLVEKYKLRLPVFGTFFRFVMIESFSTTMSILIESGVPIIYSLDISERSQPNRILKQIISEVKASVREGKSFATPLGQTEFFPPMVIQMISTGEEIGELADMFKKISQFYRQYLEAFVARMTALFEPLMIVFMGAIIGAMVISIFLPIFSLASGVGG